jgi:glycosyltransferase involved in cell wall biosynthesis
VNQNATSTRDFSHTQGLWTCLQIGAREHYSVPRALQAVGLLSGLITDVWVRPPWARIGLLPKRWTGRSHVELTGSRVAAFTLGAFLFEARARAGCLSGWNRVRARNQWFQRQVVNCLNSRSGRPDAGDDSIVRGRSNILFSYSYAGLEPLRLAKSMGWRTVLGQVDPGPVEERIVRQATQRHSEFDRPWEPAPPEYWRDWREECNLADRIVVNSGWSRTGLAQAGIDGKKILVIPLAYERSSLDVPFRSYPKAFSPQRPIRVLFLGQMVLRKGIAEVLEAARLLAFEPVEFWMVGSGPLYRSITSRSLQAPGVSPRNVRWFGAVPRSDVAGFYRDADVFLFPTHSDGFGLTQLEAQAWKLPVIASRKCGEVVRDGENGLLLDQVTPEAIVQCLQRLLAEPGQLVKLSQASRVEEKFSLRSLSRQLEHLFDVS